jgi:transcriptional regulator with XRE-family HTH domain/ribosomal protein L37E
MQNMKFGNYIRRYRQAAGLSLRELAEIGQINPAYLSRVERGIVPPSDALIRSVADALKIEPESLFLLAGRVPANWQKAISNSPSRIAEGFRSVLDGYVAEPKSPYGRTLLSFGGIQAIEDPAFPFESFSDIAELESWRKEIYRPIYHIHKWWAQRLGSVFRAIIVGAFAPKGSNLFEMFYQPVRLTGAVIFDPFMGSGTTIGEALKLGARSIGRDINPVSHFIVKNAMGLHPRKKVIETFRTIERDVAPAIRRLYQARLPEGGIADVLYYFWAKIVSCPKCERMVDLFSSYIFSQHAYPARNPEAHALCPNCGAINKIRYDTELYTCSACGLAQNPKVGPAKGVNAVCPGCGHSFPIAKTVQKGKEPPAHRLYAKMIIRPNGSKEYLPIDDYDLHLYQEASQTFRKRKNAYPVVSIEAGYNTNQVLNYCYQYWHQMFNDRQLLCLSLLADRIRKIPDRRLRDLFTCLFSGTLEFNNMFTSFKGEGTGAVRHMFSHHILKPERTPLEANLWGTPKSSGAFSTLFESRLLRALDYCENPFEISPIYNNGKITGGKVYGLSCNLGTDMAETFDEFQGGKELYLSCGDSAKTDLATESVDAVVTDPPFFDNVHYSQLADFFYVWQRHVLGANGNHNAKSTRSDEEVQQSDPTLFTERLYGVWKECNRVLRREGLLIFTYHHSRNEGWRSVLEAITKAGFAIVATHPIKAEMSVAKPKLQAKEPIDLDIIIVCRKRENTLTEASDSKRIIRNATQEATEQIARFNASGRSLSRNDVYVILMSQVIKRLSWQPFLQESLSLLDSSYTPIERAIGDLHRSQRITERPPSKQSKQLALW